MLIIWHHFLGESLSVALWKRFPWFSQNIHSLPFEVMFIIGCIGIGTAITSIWLHHCCLVYVFESYVTLTLYMLLFQHQQQQAAQK